MYIKIGNTEIKYKTRENSFTILSEVLNSTMSFEKPTIVNTADELRIWFGDSFKEIYYMEELLRDNDNLSLYLFRPYQESSYLNRDTLRLLDGTSSEISYYFPVYSELGIFTAITNRKRSDLISLEGLVMEDLINGYQSYSFTLSLEDDFLKSGWFFIIPTNLIRKGSEERVMLYYDIIPNIPVNLYDKEVKISNKEELLKELESSGFTIEYLEDSKKYIITSGTLKVVDYFYSTNISGFSLEPNFRVNNELITEKIGNEGIIEFISKTIGGSVAKDSILEGNNISVEILPIGESKYRVIISRLGYIEYFEGYFITKFGEERLDDIISRESKLVYCNLLKEAENIPEGKWPLLGSYPEEYNSSMYINSIEAILDNEKSIYPDFLLIPNVKDVVSSLDPDLDYYKELEDIKNLLESVGTQALIQNSDNGWIYEYVESDPVNPQPGVVYVGKNNFKILNTNTGELEETTDREIINTTGNDFFFNYIDDPNNILLYFYRPINLKGYIPRPGYYLFLNGFLQDIYSMSTGDINYESPTDEKIISKLIDKKSNYLVENNLYWFYEKYQNGESYNTTGWMRFIIGKVSREIEKKKWLIVSKKNQTDIKKIIESVISGISKSYSMIRTLKISDMSVDMVSEKVSLTIETTISDLPENNFIIDVTLNYN